MGRLWVYISIYLLTIADVLLTYIGLEHGVIKEANPIMNIFFSRWPKVTAISVLVVMAIVLYFFYSVRNRVKWLVQALTFLLAFKALIVLLHSFWIILIC